MLISYTYTSATGIKIPITNQLLGVGPSFSLILSQGYDGRTGNYIFNACKCSKLNLPTKQDDFTIFDMDIMASADAAGNIGSINLGL